MLRESQIEERYSERGEGQERERDTHTEAKQRELKK